MDKQVALKLIDEVFALKGDALMNFEIASNNTLRIRQALENAKAEATQLPEWAELKNDKAREAFLRLACEDEYARADGAAEFEKEMRHKLTMADLEVERARLIVKVNCEWQV